MSKMLLTVESDLLDDRQSLYADVTKREAEDIYKTKISIEPELKLISSMFVTEKRTYSQIREEKDTYQIG